MEFSEVYLKSKINFDNWSTLGIEKKIKFIRSINPLCESQFLQCTGLESYMLKKEQSDLILHSIKSYDLGSV
jgi:hypothetical protein